VDGAALGGREGGEVPAGRLEVARGRRGARREREERGALGVVL
jgi:hypothetical protein